ncbi:PQQ-dependent sugar dehydrogenase [Lacibacterium aquatile]|uniref:PQQ-dependent sugar dehydrogenase n=1 Tax=Lacibacterium aquatile TaxID=1168082 RepID=A0ABW5DNZ4_9PROT
MRRALPFALLLLATPTLAQEMVSTQAGPVKVETITRDLKRPWALDFLPDGHMLVSERDGYLRIVGKDGKVSAALTGTPEVFAQGQGGMLDVGVAPDFASSRLIYFTFSEKDDQGLAGTTLARGKLSADSTALEDLKIVFRQSPKVDDSKHFGSRILFARDGTILVTLADRFQFDPAQDLTGHLGKIVRVNPDGTAPKDNPLLGQSNAKPEIWSYGHRNIQSAALDKDGALWIAEMGPLGGDELTRVEAGKNYGWPLVSYGRHYNGRDIPNPKTRPEFQESTYQWTPVIAPSGMAIYSGSLFPSWQGSLLIGGLRAQAIVRVTVKNGAYDSEERIKLGARIRDVVQGPDGAVYALTDESSGRLLRLSPAS